MAGPEDEIPDLFPSAPNETKPREVQSPRPARDPSRQQAKSKQQKSRGRPESPGVESKNRSSAPPHSTDDFLQLDYGATSDGGSGGRNPSSGGDELEFDPVSSLGTDLGWSDQGPEGPALELDFQSEGQRAPRTAGGQKTKTRARSSAPAASPGEGSSSRRRSSAPAGSPDEGSSSRRRSSAPAGSDSQPPSSGPAFAALEFGIPSMAPADGPSSTENAPAIPQKRSSRPPQQASSGQAPTGRTSAGVRDPRSSAAPKSQQRAAAPDFPNTMFGAMDMSGGPAGWDLEEMETGAELNVAVPMPSRDDEDLPWPSARTPESEDLPVDAQKVQEISGFGPKPSNFLLTPLYFVRVSTGIRQLRAELRRAESELAEAEKTRDERLAELAEARRAELSEKDRFAPLYANADRYDSIIQEQQRSLEQSDAHAAQDLARVEDQLLSAKADREEKQAVARQQLEVRREGERNVARQRALLKRLEIEERNIVDRARRLVPAGADMPAELAGPYSVLQEEKQSVQERIAEAEQLQRSLDERHAFADDELGRTIAELQRIEGQKEALLMTHEGRMAEQARAIEESRGMRLKEKAHAGRSIVELHGEVPLERDTRLALLASDQAVERAAVKIATIREALHCYDGPAYGMGRGLLIATGSALLLLLLYVLVM